MNWEDAMAEARIEIGYNRDEYVEDWDRLVEVAHSIQDYNREETQDDYQEYLKSSHWKKTREIVLKRDNNKCVDCGLMQNRKRSEYGSHIL